MVLDVKFMDWAGAHGLDTAKLKAAKLAIFGKWYYPEIPSGVPLVNLRTGEARTFDVPMIAGETLWVAVDDLRRAGLFPSESSGESVGGIREGEPIPAPAAVPAPQADLPPVPPGDSVGAPQQPGASEEGLPRAST
jgi:hypothetical protein